MSKLKSVVNILKCSHSDFNILNLLTSEAKNIYNFSIFCIQFFNKFKYFIFNDLQLILNSKILINIDNLISQENIFLDNIKDNITIQQHVYYSLFKKYLDISINTQFLFYKNNKSLLNDNNKNIFLFVKNFLKDKEITNSNYHIYKNYYLYYTVCCIF